MRLGLSLGLGTGGAPPVFDPASVAGLIEDLWANPALVTLSGSKVTTWTDRADHADGSDATQGTDANRPTYNATGINGRPSIDFAATQYLSMAMNASIDDWTMVLVVSPTSITGGQQCLLDWQTGRLAILSVADASAKVGWYDGNYRKGDAALGAQVLTFRLNNTGGNSAAIRRNGTDILTGQLYAKRAMAGAGQAIGNTYTVDSQFAGKIARITIYRGNLTTAQCQTIERGFGSYYGITVA